ACPGLRGHHFLPLDRPVDGQATDQAHVRNDLLLLHRLGRRGGTAGPPGETERTSRLNRHRVLASRENAAFAAAPNASLHCGERRQSALPTPGPLLDAIPSCQSTTSWRQSCRTGLVTSPFGVKSASRSPRGESL